MLGSMELLGADDRPVIIGAGKRRAVLAALALEHDRVVPVEQLVDLIWGHDPPHSAKTALQGHISWLRRALGTAMPIETRASGYLLRAAPHEVDVHRFRCLFEEAAAAHPEQASELLREGLALWRGPALVDVPGSGLRDVYARPLEAQRLSALERLAEHLLAAGRSHELLDELHAELVANPLREPLARALVLALYQQGQQAEAIDVYHRVRESLATELGVDPGMPLREAYQTVLRGAADPRPESARPDSARPGAVPAQLPRVGTGWTGRETELRWMDEHVRHQPAPVLVLTGPPGVGKTSLAVHWAHRIAHEFPDGRLFVDLRGFDAGEPLAPTDALLGFLHALGVSDHRIPDDETERAALLRTTLAGRRLLVVLDNAADDTVVRTLLPGGDCAVVVTSRHRLDGLAIRDGAARLPVPPLPLNAAVELIENIAGPECVHAEPTATEALARLCECLPLALRVAAARLSSPPAPGVAALVSELSGEHGRLDGLSTSDPSASVRAALAASVRVLTEPAAELFTMLGLHPCAQVTVHAAAAMAGSSPARTRELLDELVAANLYTDLGGDRFVRHDLARLYGNQLAGELPGAVRNEAFSRLLDYYLDATRQATSTVLPLLPGVHPAVRFPAGSLPVLNDAPQALGWFETEEAGIRELLERAAGCQPERVWRLAANTSLLYNLRGNTHYGRGGMEIGLRAARAAGAREGEVELLNHLGSALIEQRNYQEAIPLLRDCVRLAERFVAPEIRVHCHERLANCATMLAEWDEAIEHYRIAIELSERLGNPAQQALAWANLGEARLRRGEPVEALHCTGTAFDLLGEVPEPAVAAVVHYVRAQALEALGRWPEALRGYRRSGDIAHLLGNTHGRAVIFHRIGDVLQRTEHPRYARLGWERARELYAKIGRDEAVEMQQRLDAQPIAAPARR
ncbi:MAG: SARP family transcriptional regulator [Pseudonocardiaceae bacterium]|nr:SARP family transcriptional regulator [Pseudonocardiaceae bacterium]